MRPFCQLAFLVLSPAKCLVNFFERREHILMNPKRLKKTFEVILLKIRMILTFTGLRSPETQASQQDGASHQ